MCIRQIAATFALVVSLFPPAAGRAAGGGLTHARQEQVQGREAREVTERNALRVLEEVIGEAAQLTVENRLLVLGRAADLLWPHDEQRARTLFKALSDEFAATAEGGGEAEEEARADAYAAARQHLLTIVARHDPRLASDFLRATRRAATPEVETQLKFALATQVASSDPTLAAQLAEQSIKDGFPPQLPDLLARLRDADPQAAARVVEVVVARLRRENLSAGGDGVGVALDLLRLNAEAAGAGRASPLLGQQVLRELVEMLSAAALQSPSDDEATLLVLQSVLPQVEAQAPALAERIRRRVAARARADNAGGGAPEGGTHAEARGTEPTEAGDRATYAGRVEGLIEEAARLAAAGQNRLALDALDRGRAALAGRARNSTQLNARLQLVRAYAPLDAGRSFELLEATIDQLNELADAAAVVDGFMTDEELTRDGQLRLHALTASFGQMVSVDAADFAPLARTDFTRMQGLANGFRRPELRIMAHLLLAESVLGARPAAEKRRVAASVGAP
ncbi:MAG TPA: hypothetical protein VF611_12215 [Pyrinomonadaceae bacterium]|jgi:hypothetical protein